MSRFCFVFVLTVASLIIGAAGLVVAIVAVRLDARTANRISDLEEARRHDELAPRFGVDCKIEEAEWILEIVLRSPQDLDDVEFALVFAGAGMAPIAAVWIGRDRNPVTEGSLGPMLIGQARPLFVALEPNRTRQDQRMILTGHKGDDAWHATIDLELSPESAVS